MTDPAHTNLTIQLALAIVIGICLTLPCTTCGCLSLPSGPDEGPYQPPSFEPTIRPTHIPSLPPTIVCEPGEDQTATAANPVAVVRVRPAAE